jgi:hypothetical protein
MAIAFSSTSGGEDYQLIVLDINDDILEASTPELPTNAILIGDPATIWPRGTPSNKVHLISLSDTRILMVWHLSSIDLW